MIGIYKKEQLKGKSVFDGKHDLIESITVDVREGVDGSPVGKEAEFLAVLVQIQTELQLVLGYHQSNGELYLLEPLTSPDLLALAACESSRSCGIVVLAAHYHRTIVAL